MARVLARDLNVSELLQMRENGMTNKEIGDAVGVSDQTIYRLIGPQGGRVSRHSYAKEPKKIEEPQPAARLAVQNKCIELHGRYGAYLVDCKEKSVLVTLPKSEQEEDAFDVDFKKLDDLIGELQAIQRKVKELTAGLGSEMW